jgi:hypothetical protein
MNSEVINQFITQYISDNKIISNNSFEKFVNEDVEKLTGYKIYNKNNILEIINSMFLNSNFNPHEKESLVKISSEISRNIVPQINFNKLFSKDFGLSLIFRDNKPTILYKNKILDKNSYDTFFNNIKTNNLNPSFIDSIILVIAKFNNMDLSVKYYCSDIPEPYWNLFQIKSKKYNPNSNSNLKDEYKKYDDVISGKLYYQEKPNLFLFTDDELSLDIMHRMEIVSYLNDNEINIFLQNMEKIDEYIKKTNINSYDEIGITLAVIQAMLDLSTNSMMVYYIFHKMLKFLSKIPDYLENNNNKVKYLIQKINEFAENIFIITTAGLQFSTGIVDTIEQMKNIIDNLEIKNNPNYKPQWNEIFSEQNLGIYNSSSYNPGQTNWGSNDENNDEEEVPPLENDSEYDSDDSN